jgi:prepilin peptidase CpaA
LKEHGAAVAQVLVLSSAVWISWTDWRRRKIPNAAILLLLVAGTAGMAFAPASFPARGWLDAGLGLAAGTIWTLPGYFMRQMGAGDVKYAAAIGWLCGAFPGVRAQLYGALILGAYALAAVLLSRRLGFAAPRVPAGIALSAGLGIYLWQYWQTAG